MDAMTNEPGNSRPRPITVADWLEGARLRTLPAAAAPVLIGAGAAWHLHGFSAGKSLLALIVALTLQVGVNFANDYSDGIRGTDAVRVGPTRLTASGLVSPKGVLGLAMGCFALAGLCGLALVTWAGTWWMLAVGVLAIAAAWFYTGGRHPYGYMGVGLSELLVFVFFGLVATVGTAWVQVFSAPLWLWLAAAGMGLCSVALLLVNNVRDIATDTDAGKRTLAVRIGDRSSRAAFVTVLVAAALLGAGATAIAAGGIPAAAVLVVLLAGALWPALPMLRGASGLDLLGVLRSAGLYALAFGIVMTATLILTA